MTRGIRRASSKYVGEGGGRRFLWRGRWRPHARARGIRGGAEGRVRLAPALTLGTASSWSGREASDVRVLRHCVR